MVTKGFQDIICMRSKWPFEVSRVTRSGGGRCVNGIITTSLSEWVCRHSHLPMREVPLEKLKPLLNYYNNLIYINQNRIENMPLYTHIYANHYNSSCTSYLECSVETIKLKWNRSCPFLGVFLFAIFQKKRRLCWIDLYNFPRIYWEHKCYCRFIFHRTFLGFSSSVKQPGMTILR